MAARELILVRHGESEGNVARHLAWAQGSQTIDVGEPDPDVALTALGRTQAAALGRWLAALPADGRPQAVWTSPYRRAADTARIALDAAGLHLDVRVDERLRDRELGVLDMLTGRGIAAQHPDEAVRRRWLGKFFYRPPGGESWADVALRLRSVLLDIDAAEPGRRVLVTAHDAVVVLTRYICEHLDVETVLEISRSTSIANASITRLVREDDGGRWQLAAFNDADHVEGLDAEG